MIIQANTTALFLKFYCKTSYKFGFLYWEEWSNRKM